MIDYISIATWGSLLSLRPRLSNQLSAVNCRTKGRDKGSRLQLNSSLIVCRMDKNHKHFVLRWFINIRVSILTAIYKNIIQRALAVRTPRLCINLFFSFGWLCIWELKDLQFRLDKKKEDEKKTVWEDFESLGSLKGSSKLPWDLKS